MVLDNKNLGKGFGMAVSLSMFLVGLVLVTAVSVELILWAVFGRPFWIYNPFVTFTVGWLLGGVGTLLFGVVGDPYHP